MRKVEINVQGRIQGVRFRYTTKMATDQLGMTGTVKNEGDGSIIIEAIGDDNIIQKLIGEVKEPPNPGGRVQYADIQEDPVTEERKEFDVVG